MKHFRFRDWSPVAGSSFRAKPEPNPEPDPQPDPVPEAEPEVSVPPGPDLTVDPDPVLDWRPWLTRERLRQAAAVHEAAEARAVIGQPECLLLHRRAQWVNYPKEAAVSRSAQQVFDLIGALGPTIVPVLELASGLNQTQVTRRATELLKHGLIRHFPVGYGDYPVLAPLHLFWKIGKEPDDDVDFPALLSPWVTRSDAIARFVGDDNPHAPFATDIDLNGAFNSGHMELCRLAANGDGRERMMHEVTAMRFEGEKAAVFFHLPTNPKNPTDFRHLTMREDLSAIHVISDDHIELTRWLQYPFDGHVPVLVHPHWPIPARTRPSGRPTPSV